MSLTKEQMDNHEKFDCSQNAFEYLIYKVNI